MPPGFTGTQRAVMLGGMYRVEYFCPRQDPTRWQPLTEGLIFKTVRLFPAFGDAVSACDALVWQYHAAHVVDGAGNVVYQI